MCFFCTKLRPFNSYTSFCLSLMKKKKYSLLPPPAHPSSFSFLNLFFSNTSSNSYPSRSPLSPILFPSPLLTLLTLLFRSSNPLLILLFSLFHPLFLLFYFSNQSLYSSPSHPPPSSSSTPIYFPILLSLIFPHISPSSSHPPISLLPPTLRVLGPTAFPLPSLSLLPHLALYK